MNAYPSKQEDFKGFMKKLRVDLLVCAGDWATNDIKDIEDSFRIIRDIDPYLPVITVMGNHDFWSQSHFESLDSIFFQIEDLCKKYKISYLQQEPYIDEEEKIAFFGFDGWYHTNNSETNDYHMMPQKNSFGASTYHVMKKREMDAYYKMLEDIKKYPDHKKVCVTHFDLILEKGYEALSPNPNYKDELKEKFSTIIMGHSHKFKDFKEEGCRFINVGADYYRSPTHNIFFKIINL